MWQGLRSTLGRPSFIGSARSTILGVFRASILPTMRDGARVFDGPCSSKYEASRDKRWRLESCSGRDLGCTCLRSRLCNSSRGSALSIGEGSGA